jgi:hypothetical protein
LKEIFQEKEKAGSFRKTCLIKFHWFFQNTVSQAPTTKAEQKRMLFSCAIPEVTHFL